MKLIFKSLLFFSAITFGASAFAQSQNLPLFKLALTERDGEDKSSINEAKAQMYIPVSANRAFLIEAGGLRAYQTRVRMFDDSGGWDGFEENLGLLKVFVEVDPEGPSEMVYEGKLNNINDFVLNAKEEESVLGTTEVSVEGTLPAYLSEEERQFRLSLLNKNKDRQIRYSYFEEYRKGHSLSVSDKFLNENLSIEVRRAIFEDEENSRTQDALIFSVIFSPKTDVWTKLESDDKQGSEKLFRLGFGANYKLNPKLSVYGRSDAFIDEKESEEAHLTKYEEWLEDDGDYTRFILGLTFSRSQSDNNITVSAELYNKNYENSEREDDTGAKMYLQMGF